MHRSILPGRQSNETKNPRFPIMDGRVQIVDARAQPLMDRLSTKLIIASFEATSLSFVAPARPKDVLYRPGWGTAWFGKS